MIAKSSSNLNLRFFCVVLPDILNLGSKTLVLFLGVFEGDDNLSDDILEIDTLALEGDILGDEIGLDVNFDDLEIPLLPEEMLKDNELLGIDNDRELPMLDVLPELNNPLEEDFTKEELDKGLPGESVFDLKDINGCDKIDAFGDPILPPPLSNMVIGISLNLVLTS